VAGPLRSARIVYTGTGKDVIEGGQFRKHVTLNPEEEEDYLLLIDLISSGQEVPDRFYSATAGHADRLLADYGVMHLHLGGAGSSTLLFLIQFADKVVLLETNTHQRFRRECAELIRQHRLTPVPKTAVIVKKKRRPARTSPSKPPAKTT